ncbi:efflux RND transporter periplasmic adaptor subunit [Pseudoalteromonas sp. JBTF-M23]|uniref:Efflux RND transporter periplasmic adaptor subunit n=1 Tax=Pseudoalteromonas caenipelagi TaxID=2726988 RepID=A0A849VB18_9GAMM|nr:efflux RND transporter periplasmic adaptor subunit [Pseudoalteromonas caenipelagi]NOU50562.1 efflux RND transporter periplasmic adaptor subunit [Pseudoalteromonas caenipelagi]
MLLNKFINSCSLNIGALLIASNVAISTVAYAKAPVTVETLTSAPLKSELAVHGTLYGKQDVKLTAGVGGLLIYVAEPGKEVKKGEVLARIDTLPLELEQARQQEMLNRAKINLQFQRQELKRLKQLAKTSSTAASQVDKVQQQHDLAQSDIALAEIELKVIADKLNRSTLRAPFSGVVSERYSRSGKDINRADELLSLIDINNLEARLYVPVKYLKYIKKGMVLPISSGNLGSLDKTDTTVTAVIPTTDPRSQSFEVRATLPQQSNRSWAAGQLVDVVVPLSNNKAELLVNRDALILRKQGVHIVRINKDSKAEQVPVTVGKGQGKYVVIQAISEGSLSIGDTIAVRGAERLSTGQEVEVQQGINQS